MRSLVTGGAGFIGSNIVDKLLELGHEVVVIDNESSEAHEHFYWNDKCKNHKLDICNFELIKDLFKNVDYVFHLAAEARIQPSINNPIHATHVNVVGTCNVLEASRQNKVKRVIYSSTSAAYGLKNEIPYREDMPKDCLNVYSVSKTAGEDLCKMYYNLYGLETISFRYFNVYGERQPTKGQYAPVIGLFIRQKNENKPMTIVGDGLQRRDFTHVSDVVEANILASICTNKEALGNLFNVGTGTNYSVLDIAQMIGGEYVFIPPRIGEAKVSLANNCKAKQLLNWEPKVLLLDWISKNK